MFLTFVFLASLPLVRCNMWVIVIVRQPSCWAAAGGLGHKTLSCASRELPAQAPSGLGAARREFDYISIGQKVESEDICDFEVYSAKHGH